MITEHINDTLTSDARRQRGKGCEYRCFRHIENFLILPEGLVAINGEEVGGWARKNRKRRKYFQQ
jgi:hypothetical protein